MDKKLQEFSVVGLYGATGSLKLQLSDNTLILVGENGSGKTTLLRMLFYFLSGRWSSLLQFKFNSVSALIGGVPYSITHEELVKAFRIDDRRFLSRLPPPVRDRVTELIRRGEVDRIPVEVERLLPRYGLPAGAITRELMEQLGDLGGDRTAPQKSLQGVIDKIQSSIGAQILYLPTYRRIERELSSIFEGADTDDLRRHRHRQLETDRAYIELVEFGMRDVQRAINDSLEALKEFVRVNLTSLTLRYFGDVVNLTKSHLIPRIRRRLTSKTDTRYQKHQSHARFVQNVSEAQYKRE